MTLHLVTPNGPAGHAWEVAGDLGRVTIGEVAKAVGLPASTGSLLVDGRPVASTTTVADAAVLRGSRLQIAAPSGGTDHPAATEPVAWLHQVAGLAAGRTVGLPAGAHSVGPALAGQPGLGGGLVDGPGVVIAVEVTDRRVDRWLELPGALFRLSTEPPAPKRRQLADERGLVVVHRPPRGPHPAAAVPPGAPPLPAEPPEPAALSWVTVLGPLPVVAAMALLFSSRFVLLGIAGPVLATGRWAEGRLRHRRASRRHAEAVVAVRATHAAALRHAAETERDRRWARAADPATVRLAVAGIAAPLWERRTVDDDALTLCLGAVAAYWPDDRGSERVRLAPSPQLVPLAARRAIGVVGSPVVAVAVARWLTAQAAALHGPADLAIAGLVSAGAPLADWTWLKWLPHLVDRTGSRLAATTPDDATGLLASMVDDLTTQTTRPGVTGSPAMPHRFGLLIASAALARHRSVREQLTRHGSPLRAIVLAEAIEELPAWCDVVLEVADDGTGRLTDAGVVMEGVVVTGVDQAWIDEVALALARLDDPERESASAGAPDRVGLASTLGLERCLHDAERLADGLERRWASGHGLAVPVGGDGSGPFVLDLVADGPHALVAGTTGAGKSELLRSWVAGLAATASPNDVNMILVDFKGGGAFDACADLPHTVAVVTDLDAHLAARALRCLRAEVRHRETLLRDAGASGIDQYRAGSPDDPLARLVVVVDEFATLAAELPDFVSSIVDVAQRGRSLGIHLVLATQRPSGVVDNKVRANTNLRVSLRVQDDADSFDVLGTVDAARLSRRTPGRAFVRLGSGELHLFQAAIVSTTTPDAAQPRNVTVRPFRLWADDRPTAADPPEVGGPTDLERLGAAARLAARRQGCRPPRVPWPAPLPERLDAFDLWATVATAAWAVPFGLADEPDQQRQTARWWRATDGDLLILGTSGRDTSRALTTIAIGLADTHDVDDVHLYVIDGGSGALAPLGDLPHCGAYASGGDTARAARILEVLAEEVERRRRLVRAHRLPGIGPDTMIEDETLPLVILTVENAGAVIEALDGDGERDALAHLAVIVRDGAALGVVAALGAPHERSLPGRLAGIVPQRVVLRLADVTSYLALGLVARELPALAGLRGVTAPGGTEVQVAEVNDVTAAVESIAASARPARRPPRPVRTLGSRVGIDLLGTDATGRIGEGTWSLPLGVTPSFRPVTLELPAGIHGLVCGAPGSGRSTALATIACAARSAGAGAGACHLTVVAPRRSPLLGVGGTVVTTVDELDAAVRDTGDQPHLVLADDSELVPAPLAQALARLAEMPNDRRHLVAAGRPDALRSTTSWTAALRYGRTGVALQPAAGDGDVFRTALPMRLGFPSAPGRGFVVSLGTAQLVQIAVTSAPD